MDIQRYISETERDTSNHVYHLHAIIVHQGSSLSGGRSVAYAKAPNGQWHCFDGESVSNKPNNMKFKKIYCNDINGEGKHQFD